MAHTNDDQADGVADTVEDALRTVEQTLAMIAFFADCAASADTDAPESDAWSGLGTLCAETAALTRQARQALPGKALGVLLDADDEA